MAPKDIDQPRLGQPDWSPDQRAASLATVFNHATSVCLSAEAWYAAKRPSKRAWGRALRVAAILLGFVAAVLPVISEITSANGKAVVPPGWAAVALAAAAACVAFDRFFGFSTGWMRFITAAQALERQREEFEYAWNEVLVTVGSPITDEEVAALLGLAHATVVAVQSIIETETSGWLTDFRGALTDSERHLAAKSVS